MDSVSKLPLETATALNAQQSSANVNNHNKEIRSIIEPTLDDWMAFKNKSGATRLSTELQDIRCYFGKGVGAKSQTINTFNIPHDFLKRTIDADEFDDQLQFALGTQFSRLDVLHKRWQRSFLKPSTMCLALRPHNEKCVFSKGNGCFAACKSCVNEKRLCMWVLNGRILVLPLPSKMRKNARMNEVAYWIRENRHPLTPDKMWDE